jgi:hypothetical protein
VIEAWRSRKEPGGLAGQGKRVLTAAIGAAGIDGAIARDPEKHSTRHVIEAALGGLAGNRLINGPRENSRSRSRSRARGEPEGEGSKLGGLAAAGGLAALAGQAIHHYRENSKNKRNDDDYYDDGGRRPRGGYAGGDDFDGPRPRRSKSVSDRIQSGVDKALAKFGLGESDNHSRKYGPDGRSYDDDKVARPRGGGHDDDENDKGSSSNSSLDTDSYESEKEEKKCRQMHTKELVTGGLAAVATIHAGHSVYQSMEKRKARHKKVMEGKMSPEEARKLKSKALLQDAASVGIAALGIKGAVSEWKELKEKRDEVHKARTKLSEKRAHRKAKMEKGEWSPKDSPEVSSANSRHRSSEPDLSRRYRKDSQYGRIDQGDSYYNGNGYASGPRYQDANPYASGNLPPPPMGGGQRY